MKITKIRFFLLLCVLGLFGFFPWSAHASISGKFGVGTWANTHTEFADVRVVKGATTLYQSNFAAGMSDWTTFNGAWSTANGTLQQTGEGSPSLALVGETTWSDYTLTLKARKISGDEGFLIALGSPGDTTTTWWNLGGFGNTKHLLQMPGVSASDYAGSIQTNVWYDIKVELSGPDIRCYLNGTLIHDTARLSNGADRTDRFNQLINSPGFGLLNGIEQEGLRNLAGRNVWIGLAARATFDSMPSGLTFATLPAAQQALIIRRVNKNRMTWNRGWGFDGTTWRDGYITDNMDAAVWRYNSLGVFDKHLTANNSPGTPTADGGYDGQLRFGSQMTVRTCIHEINHALGVGTYWRWGQIMVNGWWTGQYGNRQLAEFDGYGAVIQAGDAYHFVNYGMGYDQDYSWENARRSILLMAAMRRDMGIADQVNWNYDFNIASGTFSLVPRHASSKVLEVDGLTGANSDPLGIRTANGGDNQRFQFDLQPEGTYRIRTALPGNRAIELPYGNTDNGTPVKLWDDNNFGAQRWFMIPTDSGWYKIAPLFNNFKGIDVAGISTADGADAQSWDYLDGYNQQWKIVPTEQIRPTTSVSDGTYTLTPRHAQDKVLEVYGFAGANGDAVDIWKSNGGDNQKFLLDKQSDGTYRLRTKLAGNRTVALTNGATDNGAKLIVSDDDSSTGQRWNLIPTDNGWFKIAPKSDLTKSIDVEGVSTADGARAQSWDYLGGGNQQWRLTRTEAVFDLSASTYTVAESAGTATLTVTRGGNTSNAVSVTYATSDGTAIQPADYTQTTGTLNFAANETSKTIAIPITSDELTEKDETLTLALSEPQGGAVLGSTSVATLTIAANTTMPQPGLSVADTSLKEGDSSAQNAEFTVTLSAASGQEVTVNYATANDTAIAGSDYIATSGTLTFPAGTTSKTIAVSITGDTVVEPNEIFKVNLSAPTNATVTKAQATGTITNDDNASPVLTSVTLTPQAPTTNSQLICSYEATDEEGDALIASYVWKKNGTIISGANSASLDLSKSGNGDKGDAITVTVTASDGTSAKSVTATVNVANSAPSLTTVTLSPVSPGTNDKVTAAVVDADEDKEALTLSYVWKKNDAVIQDENSSVLDLSKTGNGDSGDSITVTCTATDGTASSNSVTSAPIEVVAVAEVSNIAPRVLSVLPSMASDRVGAKRMFTLAVSDANGTGDIRDLWLLINDRLNWGEGAIFMYVPSTTSPTTGQFFLRKGDAFLPPLTIQNGVGNALQTLDNGAVRIAGNEVLVNSSGNSITLSVSALIRHGLIGNNTLFARVEDKSGATDPASLASETGYVRFGSYTVTSQFPTSQNSIPTLSKLTPGASYTALTSVGLSPKAQSFGFFAKDENGLSDIESVIFLAGKQRGWKKSATFLFTPRTRRLYLRSDDDDNWSGGGQIGSAGVLENAQVKVDLSNVKFLVYPDGKSMGLSLPLQAKSGLLGQNKIWLRVQDNQGAVAEWSDDQGYVLGGTWEVKTPTTTAPRSVTNPSTGNS